MANRNPKALIFLVLAIVAGSVNLYAQFDTGRIVGTVTDPSGAVVANASVRVTNVRTGRAYETETDARGDYTVQALPVGIYRVEVSVEDFKTSVLSDVKLDSGETARANVQLQLGAIAVKVTVTAARTSVNVDTSELGATIDSLRVNTLPLNGRNFTDLLALLPGSVTTGGFGQTSLGGFETSFAGVNILLDGADATRIDINATSTQFGRQQSRISRASVDSIEEFRVLQSTYSAEYGRSYGDVVNAITKSGGNEFHGSLFEFFRNDRLDANNFFTNANPTGDPAPLRLNQFGGNLSGPIVRQKLFFFVNYEGVRQAVTNTVRVRVLNAAERALFVPAMQPVVDAIPLGNAGPDNATLDNFIGTLGNKVREDTGSVKIDWTISEQDSLAWRYNINDSHTTSEFGVAKGQTANNFARTQLAKLSWNHIFSPTTLNELGFAVNRNNINDLAGGAGFPIFSNFEDVGVLPAPALFDARVPQTSYQLLDTFSKVVGRHNIRTGFDIRHMRSNRELRKQLFLLYGNLIDMQNNAGFAVTQLFSPMVGFRSTNWNFFVQDDIRLTPRFALNLGLRYEYNSVWEEDNDQVSNFDFQAVAIEPLGTAFYEDDKNNFAPRVGFAWDPWGQGKTVVRGGFGIYYNPQLMGVVNSLAQNNFPNFQVTIFDVLFGICPGFPLSFPLPDPLPTCPQPAQTINSVDPDLRDSYAAHWNLNIQQEVFPDTVLEAAYVGTRGLKLPAGAAFAGRQVNRVDLISGMKPFPGFADIRLLGGFLKSSYNALQVSLRRRSAGRLNFDFNYTWSHELDNAVSIFADFQDSDNLNGDYSSGDIDVRHNFTASYIYDLPAWEQAGDLGRGWKLAGLFQARTGFPVNIFQNPVVFIADPLRPDPVPGEVCRPSDYSTPDNQLNLNAFATPAGLFGTLARNACRGPNFFQLDFSVLKDTRLSEQVTLQFRAEFFNLFNRPNFRNPNSVVTGSDFGASQATIANLIGVGTGRQIQFALKLIF